MVATIWVALHTRVLGAMLVSRIVPSVTYPTLLLINLSYLINFPPPPPPSYLPGIFDQLLFRIPASLSLTVLCNLQKPEDNSRARTSLLRLE